MNTRTHLISIVSALSLTVPLSSQAATEQQALDACAAALAASVGAAQGSEVGVSIDPGSSYSPIALHRSTTIYMDAIDPKTQQVVARADCRVSARGKVLELKMLHVNALSASHRSKGP